MLKPVREQEVEDFTPKSLSRLWHRLFRERYGASVPGVGAPGYWVRHHTAIKRLTEILGEPIWVSTMFHWWFTAGVSIDDDALVVQDPAGLYPYLPWFKVFLSGNKALITELGPGPGVAYILDSIIPKSLL